MASLTFAIEDSIKSRLDRFSWITWSETAREELIKKAKLQEMLEKLDSPEEKELERWSVELGRKLKKDVWKRHLENLSPEERKKLGV